jgi:hypothetical protein
MIKLPVTLPTVLAIVGLLGIGACDPCDPCDDGARVSGALVSVDTAPDSRSDALPPS